MPSSCRACGATVLPVEDSQREGLMIPNGALLPDFLKDVCRHCLSLLANHVPQDRDGYPTRRVQPEDFNGFLAGRLEILAHRIAAGRPIERCENIRQLLGIEAPERCDRFATRSVDGHGVCCACARFYTLRFDPVERRPRLFVLWASSPGELLERAAQAWADA